MGGVDMRGGAWAGCERGERLPVTPKPVHCVCRWRRETMIRSHTKADVCYTTPCGRRLRAYQEVTRYLELNTIKDLTVDNFSFSTKILVGQFLEAQGVGGGRTRGIAW